MLSADIHDGLAKSRSTPDFGEFPGLSMGGDTPFDVASDTCLKPPEIVGPGMLIQVISV